MAYSAVVIPVMIASPGDVPSERAIVRDVIHDWNDINSIERNVVLLPVGWETHASPSLGGRAQELINSQVLEQCDLLVGVFWTRIGTPTGDAESGTVEEIQRHIEAGKPAMVYFSTAPVAPQSLDADQYQRLSAFKEWCESKGLVEEYDNLSTFSEKFRRHVQITMRDNGYLKNLVVEARPETINSVVDDAIDRRSISIASRYPDVVNLSAEAQKLLIEASKDRSGTIVSVRHLGGQSIQTNSINFVDSSDRRSIARWEAAIEQLLSKSLIVARGNKNEIFEVTAEGYDLADRIQAK